MTYHYPRRPKVKATNGSEGLIFCSSANHGFVVLRFPRHGPETGAGRVEVGDFLVPWGWVMLVREACMISMEYRKLTH